MTRRNDVRPEQGKGGGSDEARLGLVSERSLAGGKGSLSTRQPRLFELYRHRDVTGKSGTGVVAHGAQWPDGTVSVRWAGATASFSNWDSLDVLVAVHGHEGATEVRWLDEAPVRRCRVCGCTDDRACLGGCAWVSADLCSTCAKATGAPS